MNQCESEEGSREERAVKLSPGPIRFTVEILGEHFLLTRGHGNKRTIHHTLTGIQAAVMAELKDRFPRKRRPNLKKKEEQDVEQQSDEVESGEPESRDL